MIRLLMWGDEGAVPRAAGRGFVPRLEALDERVMPYCKIHLVIATDPGVAVQPSIESPPAVSLAAAPAGATGPTGRVQVLGSGGAGSDPIWVGGSGQEVPSSTGKATPVLFGEGPTDSGGANGSYTVLKSIGVEIPQ
jgi:hypothetical protein